MSVMSKLYGGNAFPNTTVTFLQSDNEDMVTAQGGMTLRDYFAAKAMSGAMDAYMRKEIDGFHEGHLASMSYSIADAMLKEREE
jgi:hypothetical protein